MSPSTACFFAVDDLRVQGNKKKTSGRKIDRQDKERGEEKSNSERRRSSAGKTNSLPGQNPKKSGRVGVTEFVRSEVNGHRSRVRGQGRQELERYVCEFHTSHVHFHVIAFLLFIQ